LANEGRILCFNRNQLRVAAFLLASLLFLACDSGCANEILETVLSPDGNWQAVIFRRDCGATTGYSTQVSIISAKAKLPNKGGNVFVADTDHGKAPEQESGGPKVKAEWLDNKNIRISHHTDARVFLAEKKQSGVLINYEKQQE
jgi:hypothetical protein